MVAASMTSRERVLAAVNRRTPDRVPVDIGGTTVSTMTDVAYERLKACLGIQGGTRLTKSRSRTVLPDEAVALRLGSDTRPVLPGSPDGWQDIFRPDGSMQDEFGIVWRAAEGGHYAAMGNPLRDSTRDDLSAFPWPDAANPGRSRGVGSAPASCMRRRISPSA